MRITAVVKGWTAQSRGSEIVGNLSISLQLSLASPINVLPHFSLGHISVYFGMPQYLQWELLEKKGGLPEIGS